jgi:hypothetical protein
LTWPLGGGPGTARCELIDELTLDDRGEAVSVVRRQYVLPSLMLHSTISSIWMVGMVLVKFGTSAISVAPWRAPAPSNAS